MATNYERLKDADMIAGDPTQQFIDEVNALPVAEVDTMILVNSQLLTSPTPGRVQVGECGSGLPAGGF